MHKASRSVCNSRTRIIRQREASKEASKGSGLIDVSLARGINRPDPIVFGTDVSLGSDQFPVQKNANLSHDSCACAPLLNSVCQSDIASGDWAKQARQSEVTKGGRNQKPKKELLGTWSAVPQCRFPMR